MKLMYVDENFYIKEYRGGEQAPLSGLEFRMCAIRATREIRARTYGNINESGEIPEVVQYCCCELIDRLYTVEAAKSGNGLILQSYENDGESGEFLASDLTEEKTDEAVDGIIRSWLSDTGLLFCGVKCR